VTASDQVERRLLWAMQRGQRPWRELYWLSLMPGTSVTAVGSPQPPEQVSFVESRYRQPTERFIEAGAFAWLRDLDRVGHGYDWYSALEPFSLVTGQVARMARRRRSRLALVMWHNFAGTPLYRLPGYRQAWQASRHADFVLCLIEAARRHIVEEMGMPAEMCETVHPGVDVRTFTPPEGPQPDPVLVFVSPLRPSKGLDRVLAALPLVRAKVPETTLLIAGTGEDEPLARSAAERDPGVSYVGGLGPTDVAALLRRSAVFVTAPRPTRVWNEQFGLVYLEAMACGLPVVTTACGTNHEAVPAPNVRTEDDPEALAAALVPLLADPVARRELGAFNRAYVEERHDVVVQAHRMGEAFARAEARLG
jgi:phosphatidyl-myo-inositol dimannoside synthase